MREIIFLIVVFAANVIQGITGFAGTMLAMPPSIMLVGFDTAKPILNALGIIAGIYVMISSIKHVNKKEFGKIISVMIIGIIGGLFLKSLFTDENSSYLLMLLGFIVIATALQGIYASFIKKTDEKKPQNRAVSFLLLITAGVTHGMFLSGGPLLVAYLSRRIDDKQSFRATLSAVWLVLNSFIFMDDLRLGLWNKDVALLFAATAVILVFAMYIGSILHRKMSRDLFMKLSYVLLIFSGVSLFLK